MFVACRIWCLADVSSVSPSSEQTGEFTASSVDSNSCSGIERPKIDSVSTYVGEKDNDYQYNKSLKKPNFAWTLP